MLVSDVLLLLRYAVGDMDDSKSSYYQKINAVNAANRFIRNAAREYKPSLLNYTETQNTVASTAEYTLTHVPNKIMLVRLAGVPIAKLDPNAITDLTYTGKPTGYYMTAYNKISLWPVPDDVYAVTVYMVEASADLADSDTLPWTSDIGDLIVEYAAGLLGGGPDSAGIRERARRFMGEMEPDSVGVQSYWTCPVESDY